MLLVCIEPRILIYSIVKMMKVLRFVHCMLTDVKSVSKDSQKWTISGIKLKCWIFVVLHLLCVLDRFTWAVFSSKALHREHLRGSAAGITGASGHFNAGNPYREALFLPVLAQRRFCIMVSHR